MALLVLFASLALLIFGPRRGGRMHGPVALLIGVPVLLWVVAAVGLGWLRNAIGSDARQ